MSKVIVFGSLNMDLSIESDHMPSIGETIVGSGFITNPGGKGANQAMASAKMGAHVVMFGAVGEDAFGDAMIASLAEEGISCDNIMRVADKPTGVALITRVKGDNFITIDSGANFVPKTERVCGAIDKVAEPGDVFLCQLECDFDTTMETLKYAHEQGLYTVLNPAPAREIPTWVFPFLDFVVVNEVECEMISGIYPADKDSACAAMEKIAEQGVNTIAVTLGARGSIVYCKGEVLESVPPKVHAIDTTCAGDTYIGAFCAAKTRGEKVSDALELATKASALTTTKVGAQQAIPYLRDVQ